MNKIENIGLLLIDVQATAAFVANLKNSVRDLSLFSSTKVAELNSLKAIIEKRCQDLKKLVEEKILGEEEFKNISAQKEKLLFENEIEIEAHVKANQETLSSDKAN